jgi:hypothetical protein
LMGMLLLSCEKEQEGTVDPVTGTLPFVESVVLTFGSVDLDTTTTPNLQRNQDGSYSILDSLSVLILYGIPASDQLTNRWIELHWNVTSADGGKEFGGWSQALYVPPGPEHSTIPCTLPVAFTLNRADVGKAIVSFWVTTRSGLSSNARTTSLFVTRRNSPPAIWKLSLPDTIFRPASGFNLILFTVAVKDSDGYLDIREVSFRRTLPTPTASIQMFDDGAVTSGDPFAGDGWYSRAVRIDSAARLGDQVFEFQARDQSGELSIAVLDTITIESR